MEKPPGAGDVAEIYVGKIMKASTPGLVQAGEADVKELRAELPRVRRLMSSR